MTQPDTTPSDSQSEKEVRKGIGPDLPRNELSRRQTTASRFSVDYWRDRLFRPKYSQNGDETEVQEWYAQIQHQGRQEKLPLGSNNKEEASRKAARFYATLRAKGWDAGLQQLCPDRASGPKSTLTVGAFIEAARPLAAVRPRTFAGYAYALRKIAREAIGQTETGRKKFNPKVLGWRKAADLIPLAKLTPLALQAWKRNVIAAAQGDHQLEQTARRNINSFARNARALFAAKLLKRLRGNKYILPDPLPFQGFEFEPKGNTRYISRINAASLLQNAHKELAGDLEALKVILLALGAGLCRSEIDALRWGDIDFDRAVVRVTNHAFFHAKTDESEGEVFVDPNMLAELQQHRSQGASEPVVEPQIPFGTPSKFQRYRCQLTFERVTTWLRKNGVTTNKPLHTLRKEFGSIICASADIHAASR